MIISAKMGELEKRLIERVYEHDLLYVVESAHYRDRHMRALAWTEIGKDVGLPAAQCKDMWRKLRNCYLNAINRRQGKKIPKWKYEDEMSFLLPFIEIRPPENDSDLRSHSSNLSNVSASYADADMDNPYMSERGDTPEIILPETSSMISMSKRDPDNDDMDLMPMAKRKSNFYKETRMQDRLVYDETEMFFLSISETVKRLSPMDQAKIKMELCKMVYEAEIRQLESQQEENF